MLKRLAAILLLALFIFNLTGYRAVFYFAQQKADSQLVSSLDNDQYSEDDLITITVPLSMPYQVSKPDFERVDGEITLQGQVYKYVKRKVVDGQLILKCLPNHEKMRLESAQNDYSRLANDLVQNGGAKKQDGSKSTLVKTLSLDYDAFQQQYSTLSSNVAFTAYGIPQNTSLITFGLHHSPEQPPDVFVA
ncbi:hypothetical protein [Foetidibacter luteolus]|uniref:hypothetical protein n=1 Tax=Foetidibacter luteolus TaxID=2608880 RepID=UPI00129AF9EE|nr:hypothetical protein [Foetidibacter luteolus]